MLLCNQVKIKLASVAGLYNIHTHVFTCTSVENKGEYLCCLNVKETLRHQKPLVVTSIKEDNEII